MPNVRPHWRGVDGSKRKGSATTQRHCAGIKRARELSMRPLSAAPDLIEAGIQQVANQVSDLARHTFTLRRPSAKASTGGLVGWWPLESFLLVHLEHQAFKDAELRWVD